jgi:hypothetical protein
MREKLSHIKMKGEHTPVFLVVKGFILLGEFIA